MNNDNDNKKENSWLHAFKTNLYVSLTNQEKYLEASTGLSSAQASLLGSIENTSFDLIHHSFFQEIEPSPPPTTLARLLSYCRNIEGKTVAEIADKHYVPLIESLKVNRGWLGNLIEIALGASAGSKPTQDFINLGIELKTLTVNKEGRANSDVFVSTLPLNSFTVQNWANSHVYYKLQHVLFVPISQEKEQELANRVIQKAILWKASPEQLAVLKADWELFMDLLALGDYSALKSNLGQALMVKVKGLNAKSFASTQDSDGYNVHLPPLAFYLRRAFVNQILNNN